MTEANPQEIIKIENDDEISIVIGNVEQVEDIEEQNATKNVVQEAKRPSNISLEKQERCKEERGKDFVVYNMNEQPKHTFPRKQNILVYLNLGKPISTGAPPLDYDEGSRNSFVRMVFTLLFIMLCFTISCTMAAHSIKPIAVFLKSIPGLIIVIVMMLMTFILHYVMFCSTCSRYPPMNFVCLTLVTIGYSVLVAYITLKYKTVILLGAFMGTASIAFVCMLLALTSFDFTKYMMFVIVISLAIFAVYMSYLMGKTFFGWEMKPLHIGLLIALTVLDAIMLVIELQMILGGKSVELGEDDYALGAYMLYTSLIEMFVRMLQIINLFED